MRRTPDDGTSKKGPDVPLILDPATDEQQARAAHTGIPGGAPGIILEASTTIHGLAVPENGPPQAGSEAIVDRYRVGPGPSKDGSWPILYGGVRTQLAAGKIVSSAAYDVEYLLRQGVKMDKLEDEKTV